jgi:hypothetical protein
MRVLQTQRAGADGRPATLRPCGAQTTNSGA